MCVCVWRSPKCHADFRFNLPSIFDRGTVFFFLISFVNTSIYRTIAITRSHYYTNAIIRSLNKNTKARKIWYKPHADRAETTFGINRDIVNHSRIKNIRQITTTFLRLFLANDNHQCPRLVRSTQLVIRQYFTY